MKLSSWLAAVALTWGCGQAPAARDPGRHDGVDSACAQPDTLDADAFHMQSCFDRARAAARDGDHALAWRDVIQLCDSPAVTVCTAAWEELKTCAPTPVIGLEVLDEACYANPFACKDLASWYDTHADPDRAAAALARVESASERLHAFIQALHTGGLTLGYWEHDRAMARLRIEHPELGTPAAGAQPDPCDAIKGYECFWISPHADCPTFDTRSECEASNGPGCQLQRVARWSC